MKRTIYYRNRSTSTADSIKWTTFIPDKKGYSMPCLLELRMSSPGGERLPFFTSILPFCLVILILSVRTTTVQAGCREERRDLCEAICMPDGTCTIRAAVILPDSPIYEASLPKVLPALRLAEQRIRYHQLLPPNVHFEWMAYDDRCDASFAAVSAMDGYGKDCAHVFFGPACDYALASVARITKYLRSEGTPLITVGGFTFDFQKKKTNCQDEFYQLLRVGMLSFRDIGLFSVAVMKKYNWNHALYFYERNGYYSVAGLHTCHLAMNTLAEFYRDANITYSSFVTDSGTGNMTEDMAREIGVAHGDHVTIRILPSVLPAYCNEINFPVSFANFTAIEHVCWIDHQFPDLFEPVATLSSAHQLPILEKNNKDILATLDKKLKFNT